MQIFITGTDTSVGKTIISSWLCLHTGWSYFKPIQTGGIESSDSATVLNLAGVTIYKETYIFKAPLSPHSSAFLENQEIDITKLKLPTVKSLIVEGAGGVLVPINKDFLMIDVIKQMSIPVIIVASAKLGTINHTLLTLEALKTRNIKILGVIMNGKNNQLAVKSIEFYGHTKVLAEIPFIDNLRQDTLHKIPLTRSLNGICEIEL